MNKVVFMLLFVLMVATYSCVPFNSIRYVPDITESESHVDFERHQKKILPFDNLYIKILSTDDKTAKMFNYSDDTRGNSYSNIITYPVDEDGNINFPFVGDVNINGLTLSEASLKIQKALSDYIPNTSVIIKFYGNEITVLGEVQHEGEYSFTADKATIYQAIALAGGMTRYGDRKRIILIREEDKKVNKIILDLSSSKIIGSKYYYVEPRDIIMVEPLKVVSWNYQNLPYITVLTSISTLVGIFSVIYVLNRN